MSILVHVLLIGGATVLVVQVVQGRKEKLKFTAPPPSTSASEHRVKPSKKKTAVVPAISKHITSTAANASVTLPPPDSTTWFHLGVATACNRPRRHHSGR